MKAHTLPCRSEASLNSDDCTQKWPVDLIDHWVSFEILFSVLCFWTIINSWLIPRSGASRNGPNRGSNLIILGCRRHLPSIIFLTKGLFTHIVTWIQCRRPLTKQTLKGPSPEDFTVPLLVSGSQHVQLPQVLEETIPWTWNQWHVIHLNLQS